MHNAFRAHADQARAGPITTEHRKPVCAALSPSLPVHAGLPKSIPTPLIFQGDSVSVRPFGVSRVGAPVNSSENLGGSG